MIVKACKDYPGTVTVCRADDPESPEYDCRSIMGLIEMDATYQSHLRFYVEPWHDPAPDVPDDREQEAKALCDRLAEIVSMTLEDIERLWS